MPVTIYTDEYITEPGPASGGSGGSGSSQSQGASERSSSTAQGDPVPVVIPTPEVPGAATEAGGEHEFDQEHAEDGSSEDAADEAIEGRDDDD